MVCEQRLLKGEGPKTSWTRELTNDGELILVRPVSSPLRENPWLPAEIFWVQGVQRQFWLVPPMGLPSLPCTVPFSGKQWTHTEGPPHSSPGAIPGGRRRTQDGPLGFVAILPPRHLGTSFYLSVLSPEAGLGLETKQSSSGQLSSSPQARGPPRLTPTLSFQTMTADDIVCTRVYVRE